MRLFTKHLHAGLYLAISILLTACGGEGNEGGGGGNGPAVLSPSLAPALVPALTLFAGSIGVSGSLDGPAATARFNGPAGIAADSSGNLFVVDHINQTVRKITPSGVVTTLAGTAGISGSTDSTGATASFNFNGQSSIATDSAGNVYVTDTNNHTIRKITSAGMVTTLAGTNGVAGQTDNSGTMASFNLPTGIATDSAGNVYVSDSSHTIRKITPAGDVTTLAGIAGVSGSQDGAGTSASFHGPSGIATDSAGNIYVADNMNNTIRKITPAGNVATLAGTAGVSGSTDSTGVAASFYRPDGVAIDHAGNVYVADTSNNTIRKITAAGVVTTVVGTPGVSSFTPGALPGALSSPFGISISGSSLYITSGNGVIVVNNVP